MFLALLAALAVTLPPAPAGRCVLDGTHVLSQSDSQALEFACESIDKAGDGQIAVAIVNDLQGESRPEYAVDLFRSWGIGHKGKDDGLLILLALPPADRGIKVEVGYGLEGRLNDGKVMAAVRERALPDLKAGRYGPALQKLVAYYGQEMHQERVEAAPTPPARAAPTVRQNAALSLWTVAMIFLGVLGVIFGLVWLISYLELRAMRKDREQREREWDWEEHRRLALRAERLVKTRRDLKPEDRQRLMTFVEETRVEAPIAPARYESPAPPVYQEPVRHYTTPTFQSDPTPSMPDFGGFGGGSSGGGGGDSSF